MTGSFSSRQCTIRFQTKRLPEGNLVSAGFATHSRLSVREPWLTPRWCDLTRSDPCPKKENPSGGRRGSEEGRSGVLGTSDRPVSRMTGSRPGGLIQIKPRRNCLPASLFEHEAGLPDSGVRAPGSLSPTRNDAFPSVFASASRPMGWVPGSIGSEDGSTRIAAQMGGR